ncbi:MAG: BREX system serine/threonine kinase PglW [Mobilicoccus sp.]|nr:BREX system serine/threonine kinase PglW [Mobilicoccus sp.]
MSGSDSRWVEVSPSPFAHERAGLESVRRWLPTTAPFRAWTNFEFRDSRGSFNECDLLVLTPTGLHLVELKYYEGVLDGDDRRWRRNGGRYEDSPLLLCNSKARRLKSRLIDAAVAANATYAQAKAAIPYIEPSVFLHHERFVSRLESTAAIGLYGLEDAEHSNLPPLSALLTAAPTHPHRAIRAKDEPILIKLMEKIGIAPRDQWEAGSWLVRRGVLDEGDGWQDREAVHAADPTDKARVRFDVPKPTASAAEREQALQVARHEFHLARTLKHDAILTPRDLVSAELGNGLVYSRDSSWQRLDLWMRDHAPLALETTLSIIDQIGDALRYAHERGVAHRSLGVGSVWLRGSPRTGDVRVQVRDWKLAGALQPSHTRHAVTALAKAELPRLAATHEPWMVEPFLAPETMWVASDRARLDVFSLGALAAYLLTGRPPAEDAAGLKARLARQGGIDVTVDRAVPEAIRDVVRTATRGVVSERTATIADVLAGFDAAVAELSRGTQEPTDPLDARPGVLLAERFRVEKRLGVGSTARGLLVTDLVADGQPRRVLKVALDHEAGARLEGEAEVLRGLSHRRFAGLVEGPIDVEGRAVLVLESAGSTTLADELRPGQPLPLDYVERWGKDLTEALVELDRAGVDHRDIKPGNLGVRENAGDRKKHLVLFDFSLAKTAADAVEAGTPQYRDPFLGRGRRHRFDSAAERYSAAVVMHEMTTGSLPRFGDGLTDPAVADVEATIDPGLMPPGLAGEFGEFFARALRRDAEHRFDTAEAMAAAWAAIFATGRTTLAPTEDDDARAAAATLDTPIEQAGLTARAQSALVPYRVATVRDFLANVDAGSKYRGVAAATRTHLKQRRREWATRLGDPRAERGATAEGGVEVVVQLLLNAAGTASATVRRALVRHITGHAGDVDAFATFAVLGASLSEPLPPSRVQAVLADTLAAWAQDDEGILDRVLTAVTAQIDRLGGVATLDEVTAAVLDVVDEPARTPDMQRAARGLVRLALERGRLLRTEGDSDRAPISVRRRDGRVALLGTRPELFDAVEALGQAAQELVNASTGPDRTLIVAAGTAARRLRDALTPFVSEGELPESLLAGGRLVRVGAELAPHGATAANGDLHHADLPPHVALAETLKGFAGGTLEPDELRSRVAERFPALPRLPARAKTGGLDAIVDRAEVDLRWSEEARRYVMPERVTTTGLSLSQTSAPRRGSHARMQDAVHARLHESIATGGFLALGVPLLSYDEMIRTLTTRLNADPIDVTGLLIDAMRDAAAQHGVAWDLIVASDAQPAGSPDRVMLDRLVATCMPAVVDAMAAAIEGGDPDRPALLVEAAPLARYGHMDVLTRWTDMTTSRPRAVWLVAPLARNTPGSLLDGAPIPLGSPGQYLRVDARWEPPSDANDVSDSAEAADPADDGATTTARTTRGTR